MKNHLILGNWNALCDSCGRKFKANQLQKRWDGLMVCQEDWEQRHPQDLLRVQREQISVPWARPYPAEDNYIPENLWYNQADVMGLNEVVVKNVTKFVGDALTSNNTLNTNAFNTFAFNYTDKSSLYETFQITESLLVALARSFSESISLAENMSRTLSRPLSDAVSVGESTWFSETEHNADSLSFTEIKAFTISKSISDSVSVTESLSTTFSSTTALNGAALDTLALG
jgi:hypothetical protein